MINSNEISYNRRRFLQEILSTSKFTAYWFVILRHVNCSQLANGEDCDSLFEGGKTIDMSQYHKLICSRLKKSIETQGCYVYDSGGGIGGVENCYNLAQDFVFPQTS